MSTTTRSKVEILTVIVDRVRNTSESFSVYAAHEANKTLRQITVKQFVGPARSGQRWIVAGSMIDDPKYGKQFACTFATLAAPTNQHELESFILSGLVDGWDWRGYHALGTDYSARELLDIIPNQPHKLAEIDGISDDMIASLRSAWTRGTALAETYATLSDWGIGGKTADRLVKHYGIETIARLEADPYRDVLDIAGYGWKTAEMIAQRAGIVADDPKRIRGGLDVAVHEQTWQTGNTWLTEHAASRAAQALLDLPYTVINDLLMDDVEVGHLVLEDDQIYPAALAQAERLISASLADRLGRTPLATLDQVEQLPRPDALSDEQWSAVGMALTNTVSLLTGGPGVGKTTTLKAVIAAARSLHIGVTCMAPTGKAAARMYEATGTPASTIHSRLKILPGQMTRDSEIEPVTGLVIIDECSMLDTQIAAMICRRTSPAAHLLLVGDADQLPSVGPGAVLRDLIDADVITRIHLDKVYRNDAGIAINAARIRAGESILSLPDCEIIDCQTPDEATMRITDLVLDLPNHGYSMADVLVLTPTNDGASGRYALNAILQPLLNDQPEGSGIRQYVPSAKDPDGTILKRSEELRLGDRVMITKNNAELGVFNGQTGVITDINPPKSLSVTIDDRAVTFAGEEKRIVTLAYAITGHKSQGSEAPVVIVPVFASKVLSREWLYTVLTRARQRCYLFGDVQAIQSCLSIRRNHTRQTGLVERIRADLEPMDTDNYASVCNFAWNGTSGVYHMRRAAAAWRTLCGIDARDDEWGDTPAQHSLRHCQRCEVASGEPLVPFAGEA